MLSIHDNRYARRLIKAGPPPTEYEARKKYDARDERNLDWAIGGVLKELRRQRRREEFWTKMRALTRRLKKLLSPPS